MIPAPEDPPAQSVPANDGRRTNIDHRIAPFEESGEQCEVHASRVIHASRLDTTLDIPRQLSAQDQILNADCAGRAQERNAQPQDVREDSDDCSRQLQHALIMPESTRDCRASNTELPTARIIAEHRFDTIFVNLGVSYFMLGDYGSAAAWSQKSIDTSTGLDDGYSLLAIAYAEQGDEVRASAAAAEARRRFPDLKARTLSARECVAEAWCQFLRTTYLPAWRKAGLP